MPGGPTPPLEVIISWPPPNYTNPDIRGNGLIIITVLLLGLAYVVVGMRLWARFVMSKKGGLDDALIIFNMVS